jgi:uncharacterized membrane protein YraQ (UPF0718 family)
MSWLDEFIQWFFINIIRLDQDSFLFKGLTFFVYDVIKIFILLSILIYIASYIQSHFTPEKTRKILGKFTGIPAHIVGALLGTVTPFCSCSSIPIFIGFTKAGLPIGVTFSFLISSPLVDLASVILLASIFNWTIALAYVAVGLVIAVVGGTLISILKMERHVAEFILKNRSLNVQDHGDVTEEKLSRKDRHQYALIQVKEVIGKVWMYILIGVGIGAVIHGYIPQAWIEQVLGEGNPFSVLFATLIGIPMYADIFGTLPIAEALVLKGVGIGTVLALMMAVTALSLPSIVMLKKVIKTPLLMVYLSIVIIGIMTMGFTFNAFNFML